MNIVTTYFVVRQLRAALSLGTCDPSKAEHAAVRQEEYDYCVAQNAQFCASSGEGGKLHLIAQDQESQRRLRTLSNQVQQGLAGSSVVVPTLFSGAPRQPTYRDLFLYCNKLLKGKICMVCNADVYVRHPNFSDNRIAHLLSNPRQRTAIALTRYESEQTGAAPLIDDYRGSHDAFIFRSPLPSSLCDAVDHPQNCYKAENIVIHEFLKHDFAVANPCKTVRLYHKHDHDVRQWFPPTDEERYGRAPPQTMEEALDQLQCGCG